MRSIGSLGLLVTVCLATAAAGTEAGQEPPSAVGYWSGTIDAGASQIAVELELDAKDGGSLGGTISFPSQGEYGISLEILEAAGETLRFGIPNAPGQPLFEGLLQEGGERIGGTFQQHGRSYPFELRRGEAPQPAAPISSATRAALLDGIAQRLIEGYIYEEAGRRIAEGLLSAAAAGELAEARTGSEVAGALTEKLRELSQDLHLRIDYRGQTGGPPQSEPADGADAEPAAGGHGPGSSGIGGYQIFDGNVGYLDMVHFGGGDTAASELDRVMAELAGVRALIIDLRENLGGGPFMVRYLSTYLFDEPTHLASRVARGLPEPAERWTFETTRGERLADIPVVLLISSTTVSAGESFAFGLRNTGRATIFGERTAGGGHFGEMVDLGEGFSMFLPVGKTIHPETGEGWEAEGLAPDREMRAEYALEAALDFLSRSQ